jgi:hypothetical protein
MLGRYQIGFLKARSEPAGTNQLPTPRGRAGGRREFESNPNLPGREVSGAERPVLGLDCVESELA